jgi:hypothetical protein
MYVSLWYNINISFVKLQGSENLLSSYIISMEEKELQMNCPCCCGSGIDKNKARVVGQVGDRDVIDCECYLCEGLGEIALALQEIG